MEGPPLLLSSFDAEELLLQETLGPAPWLGTPLHRRSVPHPPAEREVRRRLFPVSPSPPSSGSFLAHQKADALAPSSLTREEGEELVPVALKLLGGFLLERGVSAHLLLEEEEGGGGRGGGRGGGEGGGGGDPLRVPPDCDETEWREALASLSRASLPDLLRVPLAVRLLGRWFEALPAPLLAPVVTARMRPLLLSTLSTTSLRVLETWAEVEERLEDVWAPLYLSSSPPRRAQAVLAVLPSEALGGAFARDVAPLLASQPANLATFRYLGRLFLHLVPPALRPPLAQRWSSSLLPPPAVDSARERFLLGHLTLLLLLLAAGYEPPGQAQILREIGPVGGAWGLLTSEPPPNPTTVDRRSLTGTLLSSSTSFSSARPPRAPSSSSSPPFVTIDLAEFAEHGQPLRPSSSSSSSFLLEWSLSGGATIDTSGCLSFPRSPLLPWAPECADWLAQTLLTVPTNGELQRPPRYVPPAPTQADLAPGHGVVSLQPEEGRDDAPPSPPLALPASGALRRALASCPAKGVWTLLLRARDEGETKRLLVRHARQCENCALALGVELRR